MGMSLKEAIKHAEEVAKEKYENANFIANNPLGDKSKIQGCIDCAAEHRQLAEWLKELKAVKDLIRQHDDDSMPEDFWYIDKIREVVQK